MEKLQAKGEVAEEELRALEMDVTGKVCLYPNPYTFGSYSSFPKIMLASWRGARLEVIQVLREVNTAEILVNLNHELTPLG
jgi:hypothetical protein